MIRGELTIGELSCRFDAEPWFEQADFDEINELSLGGWGRSSPAAHVAAFIGANDDCDLATVFAALTRSGKATCFECRISRVDADEWLVARERQAALLECISENTSRQREVFSGQAYR
ncbi:hypothetical protein ETAA8_09430 [Anatilimnocola aggregata]|uniref:Uncharacterized protein n=2 Tax=Anatilimnocola aggregata TaxID=2528021 RepID=A0A517Y6L0_9BACT|nr:hypothetical protein ETAA8_09430 [Anatilimnocola aggregata]